MTSLRTSSVFLIVWQCLTQSLIAPKQIDGGVSGLDLDADAVVAIVGGERTHLIHPSLPVIV